MPVADIDDASERITIRTQFHERHLVQQVPGARYDRATGCWSAPLSWATCIILRGLFGEQFQAGLLLAEWSWDTYNSRIEPAMSLRNAMALPSDDPVAHFIDLVESGGSGI